MTYSKIHKELSESLNNSDALTNPAKYLGPNWEDVLNFWFYVESLSDQEREEMFQRFWALDDNMLNSAIIASRDAAEEVVGKDFRSSAWRAADDVTGCVFAYATYELIGSHNLLEREIPLKFLTLMKPKNKS